MVYPKILRKQPTAVFHSSPSSPTISSAVSPGVISTVLDESVLLVLRHVFCFFLARCGNTPLQKKKTRTLYIYYIYNFTKTALQTNYGILQSPKHSGAENATETNNKIAKKGGAFQNKSFLLLIEEILFPSQFSKIFLIFHEGFIPFFKGFLDFFPSTARHLLPLLPPGAAAPLSPRCRMSFSTSFANIGRASTSQEIHNFRKPIRIQPYGR